MSHCLIFDMDGTLVDSEPLSQQAFLELLPDLAAHVPETGLRYRGQSMAWILKDIEAQLKRRLPDDFEATYRTRVAQLFETDLRRMPGAADLLGALDIPFCLASNAPPRKIRDALRLTQLDSFFGDRIYSAYEVGCWKPDPGLFLHAAKSMGFAAESCTVVEDSSTGIAAALAAGMSVVQFVRPGDEVHPQATPVADLRDIIGIMAAASLS
jgi:HAD superfamily hydrolase (TIGR01509 family)